MHSGGNGAADRDKVVNVGNEVKGKASDRAAPRGEVSRDNEGRADLRPNACKSDWVRLRRSGRSWDRAS